MPRKAPPITSAMKAAATREKNRVLAIAFKHLCRQSGLPMPVTEYHFAREALGRNWALDFAWPEEKVGLEQDGGVWSRGRHTRGAGWVADTEKLNTLAAMGWRMLRCTPQTLCTSETIQYVRQALTTR